MDTNNIAIIAGCILFIMILGLVFKIKLFKVIKLIFNSILGAVLIYLINQVGANAGIHIGLNIVTSIFVGILGVPGAILLLLLKIF